MTRRRTSFYGKVFRYATSTPIRVGGVRALLYDFDIDWHELKMLHYDYLRYDLNSVIQRGWKIVVEGHASRTGTTRHNRDLASHRANEVVSYLRARYPSLQLRFHISTLSGESRAELDGVPDVPPGYRGPIEDEFYRSVEIIAKPPSSRTRTHGQTPGAPPQMHQVITRRVWETTHQLPGGQMPDDGEPGAQLYEFLRRNLGEGSPSENLRFRQLRFANVSDVVVRVTIIKQTDVDTTHGNREQRVRIEYQWEWGRPLLPVTVDVSETLNNPSIGATPVITRYHHTYLRDDPFLRSSRGLLFLNPEASYSPVGPF